VRLNLQKVTVSFGAFLWFLATPALAEPAFIQVNSATPQNPQTSVAASYSQAQTAGNLNVVVVGWNGTPSVNSVTDTKGNTYVRAVGPASFSNFNESIYYAKNISAASAGANSVTVNFSAAAAFPDIRIAEYSGVDTAYPVDAVAAGSGNSALSDSGPLNTTNANDLLVAANYVSTTTNGPGTGFTSRIITTPDSDILEDRLTTATGAYNGTAPISNGTWVMQMVAFRGSNPLIISTPLSINPTSISAGQTLTGTVTYKNTSASALTISDLRIDARPPGGTHAGGPYADLQPNLGTTTIAAGATVTLNASRAFTSADALGSWEIYTTYQDSSGGWHDSPTSLYVNVTSAPAAPTTLVYSTNPATYTVGTAIPNNTPSNSGGTISSYSVNPALPAGLSLNTSTGVISGTPTTTTATANYTVTGANSAGSTSVAVNITVNAVTTITMGETNILATPDSGNANLLMAQQASLSQAATLQILSFYVTSAAGRLRMGIYDASGPSGGPGAKLAETAEITPVVGWNTANVVSPVSLSAGTYWLAYAPSDNALTFRKVDGSGTFKLYSLTYGPMPATFSTSPSSGASHWSFYATLSTSPAGQLALFTPLQLDKATVFAGDTLSGTVTYKNTSTSPITVQTISIEGRRPGATHAGGPFDNLLPALGSTTVAAGATVSLTASRAFSSSDVTGQWESYSTYQDSAGAWHDAASVFFTMSAPIAPTLSYSGTTGTTGTAGSFMSVSPTTLKANGAPVTVCTTKAGTPALPSGLSVSATTCVISGTPSAASPATVYTLNATNSAGTSADAQVTLTVNAPVPPSNLTYSTNPAVYAVGTAIANNNPSNSGGSITSYSVSPGLPSGLSLSVMTGVISGTPTAVTPATNYTVTGSNAGGSTTAVVNITVNNAPPSNLAYSTNPAVYTVGTAIANNNPSNSGGAITSYLVSPALPAGLSLNTTTGVISGTPTTATATANYTVTGSNSLGSTSVALNITVNNQGATYSLPPDRVTTWNPGRNSVGGIPNRTTIYRTINPSGGDDTATIQNALDTCPANQVVLLGPGTFHLSGHGLVITRSDITLRGSGPDSTTLLQQQTGVYPVVTIDGGGYWGQPANLTSNASKGTTSVTTTTNPGWSVGEIVVVDQVYDPNLTWYDTYYGDQGLGDYQGWGEGRTGPVAASRPIGQTMEIASITGSGPYTITFTTPFHIDFLTSKTAHIVRLVDGGGVLKPSVKNVGIEDLYGAWGHDGDGGGNFVFLTASYSWVKHVESDQSRGGSVAFIGTFRCVLRDSYLHHPSEFPPSPGGAGYGIVIDSYASDNLIENNISWAFNKVVVMRGSGGGNVIAYNYMQDGFGASYPDQVETGLNASHMTTPHYELFEGNESWMFGSDSRWGNSIYITVFRNSLTAHRMAYPPLNTYSYSDANGTFYFEDAHGRVAGMLSNHHWWYSFVGNVLGYSGHTLLGNPRSTFSVPQTSWIFEKSSFGDDSIVPMWTLGVKDSVNANAEGPGQDTTVVARALRDGNYDYVTNSVRWNGIGGTGVGTTPNPVPVIPDSLYLNSKPAFFGSNVWPWVDPFGSTKTYTLPAKARFDAGTPNAVP